ncbi:hypothetical protein ACEPAI_2465 [Sanghuangporus weigelae]
MHKDDADNFLKLAASLKIILAHSINRNDIPCASALLTQYLKTYFEIHKSDVKPNHHWVTHVFDQIRDFGPVYGFWTFTNEHLNKLRSLKFEREPFLSEVSTLILQADNELCGTVAAMAAMSDEVAAASLDCGKKFSLGPGVDHRLDKELEIPVIDSYRETHPEGSIVSSSSDLMEHSNVLFPFAKFHSYIIIEGRRIVPSQSAQKAPNAIIQMELHGVLSVGQVVKFFSHQQNSQLEPWTFLHVNWFRSHHDIDMKAWDPYPELEIRFWVYNDYLCYGEGLPVVIPPSLVKSQACRLATYFPRARSASDGLEEDKDNTQTEGEGETAQELTCDIEEQEEAAELVWATIGLSRVSTIGELYKKKQSDVSLTGLKDDVVI